MSPSNVASSVIELALPSGLVVRGRHWRRGPDTALLLHEPGRDLDAWSNLPELLHGDGLSVLAVDLPGHGLSDDPWRPEELPDVLVALVRSAQQPGDGKVFIVAAGYCATIALQAPAAGALSGVVAFSPLEASLEPAARRALPARPKLVFAGADDQAAVETARSISKRLPGWRLISTFPTADQGSAILAGPWANLAREQTIGFLRDCRHGRLPREAQRRQVDSSPPSVVGA